jgi:hypothetical protein
MCHFSSSKVAQKVAQEIPQKTAQRTGFSPIAVCCLSQFLILCRFHFTAQLLTYGHQEN